MKDGVRRGWTSGGRVMRLRKRREAEIGLGRRPRQGQGGQGAQRGGRRGRRVRKRKESRKKRREGERDEEGEEKGGNMRPRERSQLAEGGD